MTDEVFSASSQVSKICANGTTEEYTRAVTLDDIKAMASRVGMRQFNAYSSSGRALVSRDFPFCGTVNLREYNAPKETFSTGETFEARGRPRKFTITAGSKVERVDREVTIDQCKQLATSAGMRQFNITNDSCEALTSRNFPYKGNVILREYNAPKA